MNQKHKEKHYFIVWMPLIILLMTSCYRAVVNVGDIPENTPKDDQIYITGNFNNWDPGDERFRMRLLPDSTYTVTLPRGIGTIEYKFTRGDWRTVEKDACGYEIANRTFVMGERDTITDVIAGWSDREPLNCPRVTLVVTAIPASTLPGATLAMAGSFNSWIPDRSSYLRKDERGRYYITLFKQDSQNEVDYKITRGDMATVETDAFGHDIPVRKLYFGEKDTVKIKVENWKDLAPASPRHVTLVITHVPVNTPPGDDIYLVSNLNNWTLWDKNYRMVKNTNGAYSLTIPVRDQTMEFKFTRGDWSTVEVDRYGYEILNRKVNLDEPDTVDLTIANWKDLTREKKSRITIILDSIPKRTPQHAEIYLAGNFNGWNDHDPDYQLRQDAAGHYTINIPRRWGSLAFKFTRGSWSKVEIDRYGNDIPDRQYMYQDLDTLHLAVANWKDLPDPAITGVTIILRSLPPYTPVGSDLYLASSLNDWQPGVAAYRFRENDKGQYYLTIQHQSGDMEYKITRGSWKTVEVGMEGNELPNRVLNFGFADTVYVDLNKWRDFGGNY